MLNIRPQADPKELALRQFYAPTGSVDTDLMLLQPLLDAERTHQDLHLVRCPLCHTHHLVEMNDKHLVPHYPENGEEERHRVTCQLLNEQFEIVTY